MSERLTCERLVFKAAKLRQDTFNAFIEYGEAHLGGSFSMIEMLIALYEVVLKDKDKFILSKAHASFPLCLLLRERGYDPTIKTHLELDPENGIYCTKRAVWATGCRWEQAWPWPEKNEQTGQNLCANQ